MKALLALVPVFAVGQTTTVGALAPAIGTPVAVRGSVPDVSKGTHLIVAWATWCTDCVPALERASGLAKKYGGRVTVTGLSALERVPDPLPGLRYGSGQLGDRLPPNIVWEGPGGEFGKGWVQASGALVYPLTFLVKDGRIRWMGRSLDGMEARLDALLKEKLDVATTKKEWERERDLLKKQDEDRQAAQALDAKVGELVAAGKRREAIALLAAESSKRPSIASYADDKRFDLLLAEGDRNALELARTLASGPAKNDPVRLNHYAWSLIDPDAPAPITDLALSLRLATRAAELSKFADGSILDTYALALWRNGRREDAIRTQYRAVDLAKKDGNDPSSIADLESRLKQFLAGG